MQSEQTGDPTSLTLVDGKTTVTNARLLWMWEIKNGAFQGELKACARRASQNNVIQLIAFAVFAATLVFFTKAASMQSSLVLVLAFILVLAALGLDKTKKMLHYDKVIDNTKKLRGAIGVVMPAGFSCGEDLDDLTWLQEQTASGLMRFIEVILIVRNSTALAAKEITRKRKVLTYTPTMLAAFHTNDLEEALLPFNLKICQLELYKDEALKFVRVEPHLMEEVG